MRCTPRQPLVIISGRASERQDIGLDRSDAKSMARIYISSTLTDLREVRVEVYKAIRRLGHLSVAMEDWAASDLPPPEESLRAVRESDVVILRVRLGYGS